MKRLFLYLTVACTLFAWSCDDAESPALDNALYLADAKNCDGYDCIMTRLDDRRMSATVQMTRLQDHPVTVTLEVSAEMLDEHNAEFGENLKLLDESYWQIIDSDGTPKSGNRLDITIPAGSNTGIFPIQITKTPEEDTEMYALPLTITGVSENIQVLQSKKSVIYLMQKPFETQVLWCKSRSNVTSVFKDNPVVSNWTVEFHFAISNRTATEATDGTVLTFGPGFYVRPYVNANSVDIHFLTDDGIGASFGNLFSKEETGVEWHHFALVNRNGTITSYLDGVVKGSESNARFSTPVTFQTVSMTNQTHVSPVGFSEFRLWTVARTADELTRNKYSVDPGTKGLYVYYRLNEGEGDLLHDSSLHVDENGTAHPELQANIDTSDKSVANVNQIEWGWAETNEKLTSFMTINKQ